MMAQAVPPPASRPMPAGAPPSRWRPWIAGSAAAAVGAVVGLGGFAFVYARGYSYLTDDPAACANCHVMAEQFQGWSRGSHRSVAVCNDCHERAGHNQTRAAGLLGLTRDQIRYRIEKFGLARA
jgi:hypothetical protein